MSKLLALVVGIALAGLVVWAPDVQSQAPAPVFKKTITNCDGHGPNRDQVTLAKSDCDAIAVLESCKVATFHPGFVAGFFFCPDPCNYCVPWGCFLHGCPGD